MRSASNRGIWHGTASDRLTMVDLEIVALGMTLQRRGVLYRFEYLVGSVGSAWGTADCQMKRRGGSPLRVGLSHCKYKGCNDGDGTHCSNNDVSDFGEGLHGLSVVPEKIQISKQKKGEIVLFCRL